MVVMLMGLLSISLVVCSLGVKNLLPTPVLFISVGLIVIPAIVGTIIIFRWPFGRRVVILSGVLILNHIATVLVGSIAMEASS